MLAMSKPLSSDELRAKFPNASQSFIDANAMATGPHPTIAEQNTRRTLERARKGKAAGSQRLARRFKIIFRVRSCRPCDWDNYRCKELQDLLVHASVLPDDKWSVLQGEVIPEKVATRAEEGTLIEVFEL